MTRAPIVLSATAAGVAAVLGFHAHAPARATSATSTTGAATRASSSSSSGTTGTGEAMTQYGDVQLKVTVSGGRITGITAVALPQNDPRSSEISTYAEPLLTQSALSRQDGDVDAVSGATFTTDGYRTALQAALDQAGFTTSSTTSN